jgi:hypothetical protein
MMTITTNYVRAITAIIISLTLCACTKEPMIVINIDKMFIENTFSTDEWESSEVTESIQPAPTLGKDTAYTTIAYQNSSNHLIIEDVVKNTTTTKTLKNKSNGNLQSRFNSSLSKASKNPVIDALKELVKAFDELNSGKQSSATGFVLHIITIGDKQCLYGYLTKESVAQSVVVDRGYSDSTEAKAAFEAHQKLKSTTSSLP